MVKRLVLAATVLAATASSAFAIEVWQGDLFITALSDTCTANSFSVDDFFRAVLRPAGVEDNGTDTALLLVGTRSAQRAVIADGALTGNGDYNGVFFGSQGNARSWTSQFSGAKLKPLPSTKAKPVTITVDLATFAGLTGCDLTLQGTLGVRPGL
jgi:hypothetical protein